ncbi:MULTISPECIES: class I SAM-dependent methyltransferase [Legionella]|uniref:Methyltransferase n=1 Tax=Legionella maceachernii TaxID=466 RepID=A0A0W0W4M2_9GAMM|nr:class I SAM-dependent methyltransferase [Legionella maceachernii]KTD27186.1 methyltransferase [Legionella maceachernii]SKA13374.1 Methyltransferase domain-containing protein [Legionella maceachernii]SUP04766.1 trans-aconitate 2-methyltransferase [Legionella maceachernii]
MAHIYQNPNEYSKNNALQCNFAMDLLGKMTFDGQSKILDIGCGDGLITSKMAALAPQGYVVGTDISVQMIDFASKKYCKQANLSFVVMDASHNIFREQFDVVTSFNCLHWVKNQQSALSGIEKAAAPGAQIGLLLSHRKSLYHFILDKLCSNHKWKDCFLDFVNPRAFFELRDYKNMLIHSQLHIVELSELKMTYTFKSKEQLQDFLCAACAEIKRVPNDRKSTFLNDFAIAYLNEVQGYQQSLIPVDFWCLQVIASKPKL